MKLLFGFCLDFLLPKFWITQASSLEITKKNYGTPEHQHFETCLYRLIWHEDFTPDMTFVLNHGFIYGQLLTRTIVGEEGPTKHI